MRLSNIILIFIFIVMASTLSTITYAQNDTEGTAPISTGIVSAPEWIINNSNNYIINLLGQTYFNNHFSYLLSADNGAIGKDGSRYNVMYNYTINEYSFTINARLNEAGSVIVYNGPKKPYMFTITESNALQIAKSNGMLEPMYAEVVRSDSGFISDSGLVTENYLWEAFSTNFTNNSIEAVYIDLDSGDIFGIKTYYEGGSIISSGNSNTSSGSMNQYDNKSSVESPINKTETPLQSVEISNTSFIIVIIFVAISACIFYRIKKK